MLSNNTHNVYSDKNTKQAQVYNPLVIYCVILKLMNAERELASIHLEGTSHNALFAQEIHFEVEVIRGFPKWER